MANRRKKQQEYIGPEKRYGCDECDMKKLLMKVIFPAVIGGPILVVGMMFLSNQSGANQDRTILEDHNTLVAKVMTIEAHQEDVMADKVISEMAIKDNTAELSSIKAALADLDNKAKERNKNQQETNKLLKDVIKELK